MKILENGYDQMRGVVTIQFDNGQRLTADEKVVREYGLRKVVEGAGCGHLIPIERRDVYQDGKKVGTLPPDFSPLTAKSNSFFYDMRPSDFVLDGDKWVAARMLGPGDLGAVVGFEWSDGRSEKGSKSLEEMAALGAVFQAMAKARV